MRILFLLLISPLALAQYVPSFGIVGSHAVAGPVITQTGNCVANASALTTNCTSSAAAQAGDVIIAASKTQNYSNTPTVTFSSSSCSSWERLIDPDNYGSGVKFNTAMQACILPADATPNVVVTWAGTTEPNFTDISVQVVHSSGAWNNPIVDRAVDSINVVSSSSCPSGSTALPTQNPNDYLVGVCENFVNAETWGALTGWENNAAASNNTIGVYTKTVTDTDIQSIAVPLSADDVTTGMLVALQASNVVNCANCALVQATDSSSPNVPTDPTSLVDGTVTGDTLITVQVHSNFTGTGTSTASDSVGNKWYPCTYPGSGSDTTFTDVGIGGGLGMSCFYTVAPIGSSSTTVTVLATDCAANCSTVGGWYGEFSGLLNWDGYSANTLATSGSGSNNTNCGSLSTTQANDFVICTIGTGSGSATAGTSPIPFTMFSFGAGTTGFAEYGTWPGTGSITPTETLDASSQAYAGIAVAFK